MDARTNVLPSWATIELFGHRQLAGFVLETTVADTKMLELRLPGIGERCPCCLGRKTTSRRLPYSATMIKIPCAHCNGTGLVDEAEPEWIGSQVYSMAAVFSITPTSEALARAEAAKHRRGTVLHPDAGLPPLPKRGDQAATIEGIEEYVDFRIAIANEQSTSLDTDSILSNLNLEFLDREAAGFRIRMHLQERGWGQGDHDIWHRITELEAAVIRYERELTEPAPHLRANETLTMLGFEDTPENQTHLRSLTKERGWKLEFNSESRYVSWPPFDGAPAGEIDGPPDQILADLNDELTAELDAKLDAEIEAAKEADTANDTAATEPEASEPEPAPIIEHDPNNPGCMCIVCDQPF